MSQLYACFLWMLSFSWHNTLLTNFHTVWCLVLCDFQKSGMRVGPCLRFLTAVELLIKRLMIKLSKRDSWAELLPMSDRGHDLPSQPRKLPPAENRPCLDALPRPFEWAHRPVRLLHLFNFDLFPIFIFVLKFMDCSGHICKYDTRFPTIKYLFLQILKSTHDSS